MLFNTVLQQINEYRVIELIFGTDCKGLGIYKICLKEKSPIRRLSSMDIQT